VSSAAGPGGAETKPGDGIPSLGARGEGWVVLQVICLAFVALGAFVAPGFAAGEDSGPIGLIGGALVLAGLAFVGWGSASLYAARAFTALPYPTTDGALVETGAYRFVRHPLYGGLIVASVGASLARESLGAFLAAIALAIVFDLKRRREEAWLVDRYAGYAAYRTRTRALVPFLY
jgi:protein-S-isoprenylcysteine O-methyltransferase Ste14